MEDWVSGYLFAIGCLVTSCRGAPVPRPQSSAATAAGSAVSFRSISSPPAATSPVVEPLSAQPSSTATPTPRAAEPAEPAEPRPQGLAALPPPPAYQLEQDLTN